MKTVDEIVTQVIKWSEENTAGTLLDKTAIWRVAVICDNQTPIDVMETIVARCETRGGYLVKASDFVSAFKMEQ